MRELSYLAPVVYLAVFGLVLRWSSKVRGAPSRPERFAIHVMTAILVLASGIGLPEFGGVQWRITWSLIGLVVTVFEALLCFRRAAKKE